MKKALTITGLLVLVVVLAWMASRAYGKEAYMAGYEDGSKGMAREGWPNKYIWRSPYLRGQLDAERKLPAMP